MEKCQPPKLEDVGSNPASSADSRKEAKVVCNLLACQYIRCRHAGLHERNISCIEMECSLTRKEVKCIEARGN